jgi:ferredoxin
MSDCVSVCDFGALINDPISGLPVVDDQKCTACGACIEVCPRSLFELRPYGPGGKRVYVACMNKEKGAIAKKNCNVACTGCRLCTKIASPDEINVASFLCYINQDIDVDEYGSKLVAVCPTKAILGVRIKPKAETDSK